MSFSSKIINKMKNIKFLAFAILITTLACQSEKKNQENDVKNQGQTLLDECVKAHGGLDNWNKFEGLEYTLINNDKSIYQVTNLKDRRTFMKADSFQVGFDGKNAWALPNAEKIPAKSAAFYYNLDFYFFAIPFVLKDKGVNASYEGKIVIKDKEYDSIKISFGNDVGLTPDDVYYLYLDPKTHRLQILTYSVSFIEKEKATIKTAKLYTDWHEVQGLLVPGKMENFAWENGKLGESKNLNRVFKDIRFLEKTPNQERFNAPTGAVLEKI